MLKLPRLENNPSLVVKLMVLNALTALLLVFSVLSCQNKAHADNTITISTGEWGPFVSESLAHYGIAPRIVSAAFKKVDIEVRYSFLPWARAMKDVEEGKADLSGFWFHNQERARKFAYTDSLVDSPNVFFYLKDKPFDWENFDSFTDQTIGTTLSYSYSQAFDSAVKAGKVNVETEETDVLNFRKLLRGRIAAFPVAELVGYDLLKKEFSDAEARSLAVHPVKISAAPLHLIGQLDNPVSTQLINLFNKGLGILRETGEYDDILQQYK